MRTKHTPGPWVARPDPNAFLEDDWCVGIGDSLANIDKVAVCSERDAHLIAAAPDLLEALESVWLWMENQADGQSKGGHATFDLLMLREQRDIARAAIAKATGSAA